MSDVPGDAAERRYYFRLHSPTQTDEIARQIAEIGELWGRTPRYGAVPAVQAYQGELPPGEAGVEFTTSVPPDPGGVPGGRVEWRGPRPGVEAFHKDGVDYVKISVQVTKVVYQEQP